jgi:uncharacterized protein YndB with AHSA1/START domain
MMQSRASVLIGCTPEAVFDFITDTANDRRWRTHLTASHGRVAAIGDAITQTYSYEGKTQTIELEVSEYERPERLTYLMRKPARVRFSFQCRAEGGATRVSMGISADLPGPAALFAGRIQSEADKLLNSDLGRLKAALESE